jgi:hypothetical protein
MSEEHVNAVEQLLLAFQRAWELERVRDGMVLLNAIGLMRKQIAPNAPFDQELDQVKAAFGEAFGLTDADWEMFETEMRMDAYESFIALHPEHRDEFLGDDE